MPITWRRKKKTSLDAEALLADANSASQHVAVLHVAFMAACSYVLVIVFGTTDLDLLIGKGIRLPVVDVEVPIVGFYAAAPYLLALVHLNLLLQLQLLSRKLYAFDAAAPTHEGLGGLRDRLHIFPYSYYLVGRPSRAVQTLFGLLVSTTVILLPLASLFALQIGFLAYQNEAVTWAQRIAIWLDVAIIVALWPIIIHRNDDWRVYWRELASAHLPYRKSWAVPVLLIVGLILFLLGASLTVSGTGLSLLVLSPLAAALLGKAGPQFRRRILINVLFVIVALGIMVTGIRADLFALFILGPLLLIPIAAIRFAQTPRGSTALLLALWIGALLPPALLVDGEWLERFIVHAQARSSLVAEAGSLMKMRPSLFWLPAGSEHINNGSVIDITPLNKALVNSQFLVDRVLGPIRQRALLTQHDHIDSTVISVLYLARQRRLNLSDSVLLAGASKPEQTAAIRSGQWEEAINMIEPINLERRSLRHARIYNAILSRANLQFAHLLGAHLESAQLQGADLGGAVLAGASLQGAQLQGANLQGAALDGADLWGSQLEGANLEWAGLAGASLRGAQLQGANLQGAILLGADLQDTRLQGVDYVSASLQAADLRGAVLYGRASDIHWDLVDVRGMDWAPMTKDASLEAINRFKHSYGPHRLQSITTRLKISARPGLPKPTMESCLVGTYAAVECMNRYEAIEPGEMTAFIQELQKALVALACWNTEIARGIINQIPVPIGDFDQRSTRRGLQYLIVKSLDDPQCSGLNELQPSEKIALRDLRS